MTHVFLKNGIIEQIYVGRQNFNSVVESAAKAMVIADEVTSQNKRVKVLVNIDKVTSVTADSILAAIDSLNVRPDAKVAIYGGRSFLRKLVSIIISATGRKNNVKMFKSKQKAESWLRGGGKTKNDKFKYSQMAIS